MDSNQSPRTGLWHRRSTAGLFVYWLCANSAYAQTQEDAGSGDTFVLILLLIVLIIYFVPTVVAFSRKHPNRWMIAVINIVFGGTGLGWLGSLVWALNAIHKSAEGSNGGESGLNLFVNDTKKIELTQIPIQAQGHDNVLEQLKKLKTLHEQGVLTDDEFAQMKKPLLEALLS
jgi:Superinfection immunity protein/Short C-terminal domain